jgi:hypothetical protein
MGSKILAMPFLLGLLYVAYLTFLADKPEHSYLLLPLAGALAAIYTLHNQINLWWIKRFPQPFDQGIREMLARCFPPYMEMDIPERVQFEQDLEIYLMQREFIGKEVDKIPHDVQYCLCAYPVYFSNGPMKKIWHKYSRFVLYPHPFLSPTHNEEVHVSEHQHEDGVFIFSVEQLIPGLFQPSVNYNIAMHEYAAVILGYRPFDQANLPDQDHWKAMEKAGYPSKEKLEAYIGLPQEDPYRVLLTHYVSNKELFRKRMSDHFVPINDYVKAIIST